MTPLQDTIALIVAAVGLLLVASTTWTVTAQQQQQRPPASVRELCEEDMAKLCADAAGPQKMKAVCKATPSSSSPPAARRSKPRACSRSRTGRSTMLKST